MRLGFLQANLPCDGNELRHFLAGFLPHGGRVKLRQLLQLGLGELAGIGADRVLLDAFPIHIFRQKPLQDLSLVRIVLHLVFNDLYGNLREAFIDLHHEKQVLRRLAMAVFISHSDDRVADEGSRQ